VLARRRAETNVLNRIELSQTPETRVTHFWHVDIPECYFITMADSRAMIESGTPIDREDPAVQTPRPRNMSDVTRRAWMKIGGASMLYALGVLGLRPRPTVAREATVNASETPPVPIRARLSLNENAFGSSPLVVEAIRGSLHDLSRYTEREAELITAQIAVREHVTPEHVVLGEILSPLGVQLSIAGGPGGEFIYSTPGFTDLVAAAEQAGGVAVGIPLNERLENNLDAIAGRTNSRTRAVYIVNPHNPSGTVSKPSEFKSFVADLARRTLVIVDEAYLEYTDMFAKRTVAPLAKAGHNVIAFRTLAKAYGLAALQFGYAVAPPQIVNRLQQQGVGAAHGLNRLAVVAAAAALQDQQFIRETRRKNVVERARWNSVLDELGLRHSDSQGNFVFFETGRPDEEIAAAFLASGVQIGRSFPPLDRWTRISIGLPEENTLAIKVLRQILRR
jgi:histidinol-phosphate aminotransferase